VSIGSSRIPLFPLHTVLFPGGALPLQIFEPRYLDLVRECMRTGGGFGVVPIREGREAGGSAQSHSIGTLARIEDWSQGRNGLLNILVRGSARFDVQSTEVGDLGLLYGDVLWREDIARRASDRDFTDLRSLLHNMLEHLDANMDSAAVSALDNAEVVWRIADHLPLPVPEKIPLLAANDDLDLLEAISSRLAGILRKTPLN